MSKIQITLELPDGRQPTVTCSKERTIEQICQILKERDIPCEGLSYEKHRLNGQRTLGKIGYQPGTVIKVVSNTVTVTVRIGNQTQTIAMSRRSPMEELATKVRGKFPDFSHFTYNGRRVKDSQTLADIRYEAGTELVAVGTGAGQRWDDPETPRRNKNKGDADDSPRWPQRGGIRKPDAGGDELESEPGVAKGAVPVMVRRDKGRRGTEIDCDEDVLEWPKPRGIGRKCDGLRTAVTRTLRGSGSKNDDLTAAVTRTLRGSGSKNDDLTAAATRTQRGIGSRDDDLAGAATRTLRGSGSKNDDLTKVSIKVKDARKSEVFSVKDIPVTSKVEVVFEQLKSKYPDLLSLVYCGRVVDASETLQDLGYNGDYFVMYLAGPPQLDLLPPPEESDPEGDYVERLKSEITAEQWRDLQNINFPDGFDDVMKLLFWRECSCDVRQTSAKLGSL